MSSPWRAAVENPSSSSLPLLQSEGGSLDQIIFGRNEPALHHYHQTYASKLGEAAIPRLGAI